MRKWMAAGLALLIGLGHAASGIAAPLLVISIDGLQPRYVLEAEALGLKLPVLRRYLQQGTYAEGVTGVTPTITYPSHTTLITGVEPARHGIVGNTSFDPLGNNYEGWFWYAADLRVPTLFSVAKAAGLKTAALNWPVTVGDTSIDVLLPEYWRAGNDEDLKLLRALSRPEGLLQQMETQLGPFVQGYIDHLESDRVRTRFGVAMLREHRPDLMAIHLIAADGAQHEQGPFVAPVYEVLEAIDAMIGELEAAALANDPDAVIAVVSDHGFLPTHTAVNLRTRLVEAGLIRLKPAQPDSAPKVDSWDAQIWPGGGVAAVMLREPGDSKTRQRLAQLLKTLQADPANGIARVLDRKQTVATGGFPDAEFLVEFAPGFYFGPALRGALLTPATSKGTHGYLPDRPELRSVFFIRGTGIAAGRDLGQIDMRQIAPTLAQLLGVKLSESSAAPLKVRE